MGRLVLGWRGGGRGEPGFIPWHLSVRGRIELQLLKGRMTLSIEFTVIWFLHYISIITRAAQGVAVCAAQIETDL